MKKILILSHYLKNKGAIDRYGEYLQSQGFEVVKLAHYLDYWEGKPSVLINNSKVIKTIPRKKRGVLNLFKDILINIQVCKTINPEVIIGANNFDTLSALLARLYLKKKFKVIYFGSDFSEERFQNKLLNFTYSLIEKISLRFSNLVISNTYRAEAKRMNLGLKKYKSIIIPNGTTLDNPNFESKKISKKKFVYQGTVSKEHGLFDLLKVLHPIIDEFLLIGGGDDWERVIELCKEKKIKFKAHKDKTHAFVVEELQKFDGFGLAPYNTESKWTYYSSPLKVVDYVAAGVPVLMSDVPEIAQEIESTGLGVTFHNFSLEEIKRKLLAFNLKGFEKRALSFYEKYNSDNLYARIDLS